MPTDSIKGSVGDDFLSKCTSILCTIRSVNKSDVKNLLITFGTMKNIMNASVSDLLSCPGIFTMKLV